MKYFSFVGRCAASVLAVLALASAGLASTAAAQEQPLRESYLTAPDNIASEVLAPRHENVTLSNLSPDGEVFLNTVEFGLPRLADFARPHYNIAGLQIDPRANRDRALSSETTTGLELIGARDGAVSGIDAPVDARITATRWSPDGSRLAYLAHFDEETHLYVADLETGVSTRVTDEPVLATLTTAAEWSGDGQHLFVVTLPEDRSDEPERPEVPTDLQVRMTSDEENRLRTYPALLEGPYEAELLEYYVTGQLVRINVSSEEITPVGEPAMIRNFDVAPDGEHLRVQTLKKPFSYIVPVSSFAWNEEIWDLEGEALVTLREAEAREGIPDAEEIEDFNRRNINWRPDGEGLSFILDPEEDEEEEESDDGDGEEAEEEDDDEVYRVMQWLPPYGEDDMHVVYESESRLNSVAYSDEADVLFITERKSGTEHVYAVFAEDTEETHTIYRHDTDDFYEDPGSLMRKTGSLGERVVRTSTNGEHVYLSGTQHYEDYAEEAPRPFLDRVEITSGETERLFQSEVDVHERVTAVLDDDLTEIMLVRQSPTLYPNSWRYDRETEERTQLTDNVDHNEAVTQAQRERFEVERPDGFSFWVDVVMPADWDGEPLPGLIWHYPREFDDQDDYEESARAYNKNAYPRVGTRSADIFVVHGYAVISPDWPIAGDRGTSNDNFIWSVVQNSTAVIDAAYERGYIDRSKMAIGGHSYGAFGTANAMIHTSFFKAGIAGAGNYNRTLTPLGFQRESSDIWRGADRYIQMSPFFWAERLDGALLMYHGAEDQNVGTFPINSDRMFHALNGLGKTASLYMYPHEAHGPQAEETLLDLWRRWADWLDHYLKDESIFKTDDEPAVADD